MSVFFMFSSHLVDVAPSTRDGGGLLVRLLGRSLLKVASSREISGRYALRAEDGGGLLVRLLRSKGGAGWTRGGPDYAVLVLTR